MERDWSQVKDELCTCSHLRSKHEALYPIPAAVGKGACQQCMCSRFTWKKFVFKKAQAAEAPA
jgi:hypothetical protein